MTNGEDRAGDGLPIRLRGQVYAKGLGVHSNSEIRINLGGVCQTFVTYLGVDDEVGGKGSVVFQVWADDRRIYESPRLLGTSPVQAVSVDVSRVNTLRLVVTDADDGPYYDHADWANAQVRCDSNPPGTRYLSDLTWQSATNGWGPVEKDRSNGDSAAGDGGVLTLNGQTFGKGLGVHANSDIRYSLGGQCRTFLASVGVDDFVGPRGTIVFQVLADGVKLYDSGVMYGDSITRSVSVDITGRDVLQLVVANAGDGIGSDHGDWANARVVCSVDTTPPAVTATTPVSAEDGVPVNGPVSASFSEPVNQSTVGGSSFVLVPSGGTTPVAAVVTYDSSNRRAILAPASVLASGTTYQARVRGGAAGVKDLAGNAMMSDQVWTFTTLRPPRVQYVSDMNWVSAKNGWGPVERDMSNGDLAARDGSTLTVAGKTYAKGIGAHAMSDIRVNLGGYCTTFSAMVGLDDWTGSRGSVTFQVFGDGLKLWESAVLTGNSPALPVTLDVSGKYELSLRVTDANDDNGADHADWADAQLTCTTPQDRVAPYVTRTTPASGTSGLPVNTPMVTAFFSEALDHTTLTTANFTLRAVNATAPVGAQVSYNATARAAILDPVISLDAGVTYVATVKGGVNGVKDMAGNTLPSDVTWMFTTGTGALSPRAPITIQGQSNITLSGLYIRNLEGPCLIIRGSAQNIRLQNSELGPCKGGIAIDGSSQITVDSVYIRDSGDQGSGIDVTFSQNVTVTNSRIENVRTGVYALGSTGVKVERNTMKNMQGPMPRGQFVQFNKVYGPGNRIKCNTGVNVLGESRAEDAINLYGSQGDPLDPIQVIGNRVQGGGPSRSGGGIMLGDGGGAYQLAQSNVLVDPGQYGVAVAGGQHINVIGNAISGRQQPFTNVGIYVWNQDAAACHTIRVQTNLVDWTNSSGVKNPAWNAGNCGTVMDWTTNQWAASLLNTVLSVPAGVCQ